MVLMATLDELRKVRHEKRDRLRKAGVDPYPARSNRTHAIAQVRGAFSQLEASGERITIAGRIRSVREHGEICFADLDDGTGKLQLLLNPDTLQQPTVTDFVELFDIGDFAEASGSALKTKAGELTLAATEIRMLAKALRPLPEKWHGLQNVEERLRRRYVDLLVNQTERELFVKKASFWRAVRDFFQNEGFLEVDTPVLEEVPGGADAEPFTTHLNALDIDLYLRISPELHLKRLLVGGYEKVFEIGRIFRNEGIDREHLQDYTQIEAYWAYADYQQMMSLIKRLYQTVIEKTSGGLQHEYQSTVIDWSGDWPEIDYYEVFQKHTGLRLGKIEESELKHYAEAEGIDIGKHAGRGRLIDIIFKKKVRPTLVSPAFLVLPPVEVEPLAKRWSKDPSRAERFQIMAGGTELGKGFSELNDPTDQRERLNEQMELRKKGDIEAQMMDKDFVEALEYGMPPAAGFGVSERLFAFIMNRSVREATIFPILRPE